MERTGLAREWLRASRRDHVRKDVGEGSGHHAWRGDSGIGSVSALFLQLARLGKIAENFSLDEYR